MLPMFTTKGLFNVMILGVGALIANSVGPWLAQTVRRTDTSKAETLSAEICSLSLVEQVRECLCLPPDSVWAVGGVARP